MRPPDGNLPQRLQQNTKESAADAMSYMTLPAGSRDYITLNPSKAIPRLVNFADVSSIITCMHVVALGFHGHPARVARRQGSFVRYRHVRYGYLETTSEVEALKEDRIRFCLWETTGMKLSSCANLRILHRRSLFAEVCAGEAGENICMCGDRAGRGHRVCIGTSHQIIQQ